MDFSEGMNYGKRNSPESGTDLEKDTHKLRVLEQKYRSRMELEEETQNLRVLEQKKSWRFTYEALTHVHSLRLFLFNSMIPVPWRCLTLQATFASESPVSTSLVVLCQWVGPEGESHKLFVPMPVCLIDYSVPLAASACSDHIEIKLKLLSSGGSFVDDLSLLGFTYRGEPIERDAAGVKIHSPKGDDSAFSLGSDAELLTSKQGVTFYCRNCSVKLTKQPICSFRGLPSTEWRELADHWFGMCCCRDGVHTNSLMARFEKFLTPTKGVCLVGSTTCNVDCNDLVSDIVDHDQNILVADDAQPCIPMTENDEEIRPPDDLDAVMSCREIDGNIPLGADLQPLVDDLKPLKDPVMKTNGCSHDTEEKSVGLATCCSHSGVSHGNVVSEDFGANKVSDNAFKAKSPANGFMSSFPSANLLPFSCYNCAGLTGVFSGGREEGIQLFKCRVSSDLPTGGPSDVFRFHTLERVFSYELFSNAEEDSSYRYIVRDLTTRLPLLQLVLINHESWTCSGLCVEEQRLLSEPERTRSIAAREMSVVTGHADFVNGTFSSQDYGLMTKLGNGKLRPLFLEPVMKVMFCDTSSFNSAELSEVESWGQRNQSDDIYMLGSEVKALARSLQANGILFPESCGAFQQFHFSFLAR